MEIEDNVIVYKLNGQKYLFDIDKYLRIDINNLSEEFIRQAALYGYYAAQTAKADVLLSNAKFRMEQEYSEADLEIRELFADEGKKFTEATVRAHVLIDESYVKAQQEYANAEEVLKTLKAVTNALDMKSSMLISLGALTRQEMDMTGSRIRDVFYNEKTKDVKEAISEKRSKKT